MIQSVLKNGSFIPVNYTVQKSPAVKQENSQSFAALLKDSINELNQSQVQSDALTEKLVKGESVDLHDVMIASQKASIMLQTTLEFRNKAIEAYQETMRMQV